MTEYDMSPSGNVTARQVLIMEQLEVDGLTNMSTLKLDEIQFHIIGDHPNAVIDIRSEGDETTSLVLGTEIHVTPPAEPPEGTVECIRLNNGSCYLSDARELDYITFQEQDSLYKYYWKHKILPNPWLASSPILVYNFDSLIEGNSSANCGDSSNSSDNIVNCQVTLLYPTLNK